MDRMVRSVLSGEGNGDCGASPHRTVDGDLPAVGLNDGLANAQAKAVAPCRLRALARLVGAVKALEHFGQILGGNARSRVADAQLSLPGPRGGMDLHGHASAS